MKRPTLPQAKAVLATALATGRVVVRSHATDDKGGLATFSAHQIRGELKAASLAGDVVHDRNVEGRFIAFGVTLVLVFEVHAPNVVVVTVFHQGG